jgi:Polyketide cyclase / dehydrase and lipid transport
MRRFAGAGAIAPMLPRHYGRAKGKRKKTRSGGCLMVRALAFGLAALALLPVAAFAHGPSRQKVTETVEINASPEKVWKAIGNFQDMSWHPAVEKTEGAGGNEVNATRTLTLKSGGQINEKLIQYDPAKMTYKYEMEHPDVKVIPVNNYSSILSVKGEGDKSKVEWRGAFYRGFMNNDPPPELNDEAAKKAVTGIYRSGLDALKEKMEAGG